MTPTPIRSFEDLRSLLQNRVAVKAASSKQAAGEDVVPEKDQADKGGVMIPKDPNATPAAQNLPANPTNSDQTPVTQPPGLAKKVEGEEKPASLLDRVKGVVANIQALRKNAGQKAADCATAEKITPTLPAANNENKDKVVEGLPATDKSKTPKNPDPNAKAAGAGDMPETKDPAAKDVKKPEGDSKGELPDNKDNADKTDVGTAGKAASEEGLELDPMILAKLGSMAVGSDIIRPLLQAEIEKAQGAAAAEDIIKAAAFMEEQLAELDQLEQTGVLAAQEAWDKATPDERQQVVKLASTHNLGRAKFASEEEKQAYDQGAMAASQMADAGLPEAAPGQHELESEAPSAEEVAAVLEELVQSGQITPEVAAEILQALGGGGGGGEGMEGMEAGGEEMGPEEKEARAALEKSAAAIETLFAEVTAEPAAAKAA